MRVLGYLVFMTACGIAAAADSRAIQRAVADDALLASAGVEPARAEMRKPCSAALIETDDPPEFFDCVYVQTSRDLNLFSLEEGHLMSELQLTLANMDGVALQQIGRASCRERCRWGGGAE